MESFGISTQGMEESKVWRLNLQLLLPQPSWESGKWREEVDAKISKIFTNIILAWFGIICEKQNKTLLMANFAKKLKIDIISQLNLILKLFC